MITDFTDADVPDQSGKTFFITGANTGLGFETARVLARKGGRVLMGCRTRSKAEDAVARIKAETPGADLEIVDIDLGSLDSIRAAAARVIEEPRLDVLVNNAGIMMPPRQLTSDGFESQFGVNHLGTFALTGLLLEKLEQTPGARVVNTSSGAHKGGKIDFDDVNAEKSYSAFGRYSMSKLANLLHIAELDRRLKAKGSDIVAVTVHPGGSDTDLARHLPRWTAVLFPLMRLMMNTAAQGAWPTLLGATAPGVEGGQYFGPRGFMEMAGPAKQVKGNKTSQDPDLARRLWALSVEMTGVDCGL
ncbi:MAG: NAD(P)-dependent dehydrogenase (short-subunit alcohol dehydrogenase family) [Myxococcota bacterium]|jgi:NAD(P)-dependent dehydrogenase (short-subunit alcohol dehydrogenase family)